MTDIIERYQQEKRRRRLVDFDDILALAIRDIQSDPDYAASIRWRHRHLYVDEFQDVNPLQFELLKAWRGDSNDLFVVGDPNQAIYGWNGADPQLLQRFAQREPGTTVVALTDNYRSTPQILTLANASLQGKGAQLIPHQPDGPIPSITGYSTDAAEAAGIADAVVSAKKPSEPWGNQAVLVRTNAQLVTIEQALSANRVPVRVRGGTGPLNSQEVKDELRAMGRPGVRVDIAVANLDSTLDEEPAESTQSEHERRANLTALSRLVHEYLSIDQDPTGPNLLAWIATIQASEVDSDRDAVELATFHGAKGLEWPIVHIAGLEKGYVPISYAETGAQLAEEQRLLYVGLTRAERQLNLSWASERAFGVKNVKRQPSPYLAMLEPAVDHLRRGYRPSDWKAGVATSRASLPKSVDRNPVDRNPVDDPVFDALREWRRKRAKGADVPAYVIFNDKTLRAIAKAQPTSKAKLASIAGIGPAKLERFGGEVIDLVKEHL
ncbi:MAG: ATP-dependent DNA helicase UvrD2 [Acidimicrobiales bacterium]